jgi:hypothetical protein
MQLSTATELFAILLWVEGVSRPTWSNHSKFPIPLNYEFGNARVRTRPERTLFHAEDGGLSTMRFGLRGDAEAIHSV